MTSEERRRLIEIRPNLERRALIFQLTRAFFIERWFLEVDTPLRVSSIAPEQHIAPFESEGWFLSTSPEIHMKRLLAAGYDRLFQISHCFRRGERGQQHSPEFTILEWYRTGADYEQMIHDTEELVVTIAEKSGLGSTIQFQNQRISLAPPWPRITVRDAFLRAAGWDPISDPNPLNFDTDLVNKVIPSFDPTRPAVLKDYPATMASLARLSPTNPGVGQRAEVFIGGLELANAYSELRDAEEQGRRFQEEMKQIQRAGRRAVMPQRFLEAVAHLPDCGGIALGLDRLVMLFCDTNSIDEVIPFTVDMA